MIKLGLEADCRWWWWSGLTSAGTKVVPTQTIVPTLLLLSWLREHEYAHFGLLQRACGDKNCHLSFCLVIESALLLPSQCGRYHFVLETKS